MQNRVFGNKNEGEPIETPMMHKVCLDGLTMRKLLIMNRIAPTLFFVSRIAWGVALICFFTIIAYLLLNLTSLFNLTIYDCFGCVGSLSLTFILFRAMIFDERDE